MVSESWEALKCVCGVCMCVCTEIGREKMVDEKAREERKSGDLKMIT